MTRMIRLWTELVGEHPAAASRQAALAAYERAVKADDDREIHRTWLELKAATIAALAP